MTLVELLAVIVIISVIIIIIFPLFNKLIESTNEQVCTNNILILENQYRTYLVYSKKSDEELVFMEFLNGYNEEVCPNHGNLYYVDGNIYCDYHSNNEHGNEPVPYL